MNPKILILPFFLLAFMSCKTQQPVVHPVADDMPIAFPGAEGFGKYTTGGRGGKVLIVSNLNDDGPGSFRKAAIANGKRIIVFAVSGTIHLQSRVYLKGDVTIAGQTAPGGGICIADHPVYLSGDNAIIRFMRFRLGDKNQNKGMVDGSGDDDAFSVAKRSNVIVDHCSVSWSTDEAFSAYRGDSVTLQWNIISEPLNYSYHFEKGDKDFEQHGYGGIWGGTHLSAHHNLFAHCKSRTPRFNGVRLGESEEMVDFRNNVIYNWGVNNIYGGENGTYNIVNNYYKYGPETKQSAKYRIVNPSTGEHAEDPFGKFYVAGNFVDGSEDVSRNNLLGVHMDKGRTDADKAKAVVAAPFSVVALPNIEALDAYQSVLKDVGASLPLRDTLDQRIINDVKNRTGRFIDVQGGYPHGTAYEKTVSAWPYLKQGEALLDTDNDGMPDDWELKNNLNPKDAADASLYSVDKSYTNIEVYINSLVK